MADKDDPALARTAISGGPGLPGVGAQPMGELPSLLAERYEIQALLGVGGMGRVYRARDRALDEIVALKVLRRELLATDGVVERFRQEVKLARRVTNVHVVRTFDLGQHDDDHFLTMEYIEGRSLARVLDDGPPPLTESLRIARAACTGIAAAHHAGVLHRDLKPDNILVASTGRIAITDFGIARPSAGPTSTQDRFVGTPAYMAPEQVDGRFAIGPHTDIYAFGAILFEMLTGRRPFPGDDVLTVAVARLHQPPPDPRAFRAVPPSLGALVVRCLAVEPSARFRDASELATALAGIDEHAAASITPPATPMVPAKTSLAIAVLPLRSDAELADVASGLTEEIVDALSMTRALRVRPLAAVRRANRDELDPRELGAALGVDVVVDGSLRRSGGGVRISARAIGVADGFQLWANRFDAQPDHLLDASDEIARAVARALTVEISIPARGPSDARATELYLEGKAKLRAGWYDGGLVGARSDLEAALELAPGDPGILAALSLALSRSVFYGAVHEAPRARSLAERAVSLAAGTGEPWLALGFASLYNNAFPEAATAVRRAVALSPGLALAQAMLGALALEAGLVDVAITHLEAAFSLDPSEPQGSDLSRAYVYAGRFDDGIALLGRSTGSPTYTATQIGRFRMWRGERYDFDPPSAGLPGDFPVWVGAVFRLYRTGQLSAEDATALRRMSETSNPRLRATRAQFSAEFLLWVGDHEGALDSIVTAVDSGLQDHLWLQRCPMLEPLRARRVEDALAAAR